MKNNRKNRKLIEIRTKNSLRGKFPNVKIKVKSKSKDSVDVFINPLCDKQSVIPNDITVHGYEGFVDLLNMIN